jgi:16S rRNA (guanine527-N7)-methyltransferase
VNDNGAQKADHLLRKGLLHLGIALSEQSITGLIQYSLELLKWNRKVNLVAKKTSLEDVIEKHFLDSLTLVQVLETYAPENGLLVDVGSGAGFPGLVVKTACPDRPVILLEPRQRRVSFLNHIIRLLSLAGIKVLPHRTDEQDVLHDAHCAVITSRAVADVTSFLGMVYDLADPGTLVACMQGPSGKEQWEKEKDNAQFDRVGIEHIPLPFSRAHRTIIVFRKKS